MICANIAVEMAFGRRANPTTWLVGGGSLALILRDFVKDKPNELLSDLPMAICIYLATELAFGRAVGSNTILLGGGALALLLVK